MIPPVNFENIAGVRLSNSNTSNHWTATIVSCTPSHPSVREKTHEIMVALTTANYLYEIRLEFRWEREKFTFLISKNGKKPLTSTREEFQIRRKMFLTKDIFLSSLSTILEIILQQHEN